MTRVCTATVGSLLVGAFVSLLTVAPAAAQNYDAALQVRFGTFLQGGGVQGRASKEATVDGDPMTSDPIRYFSPGVGIVSGIELVNKGGLTLGAEIDAVLMGGKANPLFQQVGIDWVVTARARAGVHLRNDLMWFVSAGPALRASEFTTVIGKTARTRWGWSGGTGLEWDYGGGILFGEYMYAGFGAVESLVAGSNYHYDANIHALRIGLKFKIGHDHYHDDVAERIGRVSK